MHEDLPLALELLMNQAKQALQQLGKESAETTQARIRVMTATIQDLRIHSKIDSLTWEDK